MVIDSRRDGSGREYLILGVTRKEFDRIATTENMVVHAVSSQEDMEINIVLIGGETDEDISNRIQVSLEDSDSEPPPKDSLN